MNKPLFEEAFFTGCNYWASHAGTDMWHVWDEEVVAADFRRLAENRVRVIRMFPLWPDFQPIRMLYAGSAAPREIRMGEAPLPDTEAGRAGVDEEMCRRFERLCDLAQENGLRLIVGLVTGWMSGRLYVPPAMEGRNVLTDPFCINWEIRYVKYLVRRFKDHPAIAAWDLGNECNCMGKIGSPQEAELWVNAISDAIRAADPEGTASGFRPIVSGLHGLTPEGNWRPGPHAEAVDILTTHPYPIFTPYCDTDPLTSYKSAMHATAQSVWYRGLGGKPCFAEECGTLGPMIADEQNAASYVNVVLYNLWAADCRGFLWWCAAEQSHLTHAPYDWNAVERELGLFRLDGSPKPVTQVMSAFAAERERIGELPPRIVDALVVSTRGQDSWAAAWGAYLLAKQAGLDVEFADGEKPLPEAPAYILPSLAGDASMSRHAWYALLDRVMAGATLFLTLDTALLSPFSEMTGARVRTRERTTGPVALTLADTKERLTVDADFRLKMTAAVAKVLASEDANPVMTENSFGKGRVVLLTVPVERCAAMKPGVLESEPLYKLYKAANLTSPRRVAQSSEPLVAMTEHISDESTRLLTFINPGTEARRTTVKLSGFWRFGEILGGSGSETAGDVVPRALAEGFTLTLGAGQAAIVTIRK